MPIWLVGILCSLVCVVPPYALVGIVLGKVITTSTVIIYFALLLSVAIVSLLGMLFYMACHIKRRTPDHASYALDVVAEMQVIRAAKPKISCSIV